MSIDTYDRDGNPIDTATWAELLADRDYKLVARWEGEGGVVVSTVWLGLDHNFLPGDEIAIFETMVFGLPGYDGYDGPMTRYPTLKAAKWGHDETVRDIKAGAPLWFLAD